MAPLKEVGIVKTESLQAIPGGEAFNECFLILKRLKKSEFAWPFRVPVDPRSLGIPEYLNIVQEPMDLRTIEENLRKEEYAHPAEFHRDVYKIFMNSYKFNQKNSDVFATTSDFEDEYLRLVRDSKEGKLALQDKKSAKMETPPQDDPLSIKEEPKSVDHKPRPYHKRDKAQLEDKRRDKQEGVAREGAGREGEKEVKLEAEKGTDKIKDKEKEKERKLEKKLEK